MLTLLLRAVMTSVARLSNSPAVAIFVSLSFRVTVPVAFFKVPVLVAEAVTLNVSALSILLSAKIGSDKVAEVSPARIVTV